jgi:hypothetical protein
MAANEKELFRVLCEFNKNDYARLILEDVDQVCPLLMLETVENGTRGCVALSIASARQLAIELNKAADAFAQIKLTELLTGE